MEEKFFMRSNKALNTWLMTYLLIVINDFGSVHEKVITGTWTKSQSGTQQISLTRPLSKVWIWHWRIFLNFSTKFLGLDIVQALRFKFLCGFRGSCNY
jgi:hypothetical protein